MLPNFLIIGAPRSGTTYLKSCLEQHPDVYMPSKGFSGDIHFFCPNYIAQSWSKGISWYKTLFNDGVSKQAVGEKSCFYLSDVDAPHLIDRYLPDVKLIAILRNPVYRAQSTFRYNISEIPDHLSFLDACRDDTIAHLEFIESGLYYKHLNRYWGLFSDESIHIIIFDHLIEDPLKTLKGVFNFLKIDDQFIPAGFLEKKNISVDNGTAIYQLRQAVGRLKLRYPEIYNRLKRLPLAEAFRIWIGKSSDYSSSASSPSRIKPHEWEQLSTIFLKDTEKLSNALGEDLVKLWRFDRSKEIEDV